MYGAVASLLFYQLMSADPNTIRLAAGAGDVSLVQILDHILHSGVVIQGSVVISLAGVDLIYVGVSAVVTSVETALKHVPRQP
jgi:hypothetical protein